MASAGYPLACRASSFCANHLRLSAKDVPTAIEAGNDAAFPREESRSLAVMSGGGYCAHPPRARVERLDRDPFHMSSGGTAHVPHSAALYLGIVQFLFVTCWTIYVVFLPGLLESAGLPRSYTIWILMLDQLVFMVMDTVMGVAADRAARVLGRIGPMILAATVVSCVAFLLIPHVMLAGAGGPALALAVILLWTATASALRAPPLVLFSKYAAAPTLPWMNALVLTGLAIGGAIAPYLGVALKNVDPRLPFAISSLTLLLATGGLIWVERVLAGPGRLDGGRVGAACGLPVARPWLSDSFRAQFGKPVPAICIPRATRISDPRVLDRLQPCDVPGGGVGAALRHPADRCGGGGAGRRR